MLVKGDKKVLLSEVQFFADDEIKLNASDSVLCVSVEGKAINIDLGNGEAKVAYRLNYKVTYNGENGIDVEEASYDHTAIIRNAYLETNRIVDVNVIVNGVEFVGKSLVKIRSDIALCGYVIVPVDYDCYDGSDDILVKETAVAVERILPISTSQIVATTLLNVKENIDKILTTDTQIVVNKVSTATEICHIEGECYTYLTYLSGGILQSRCLVTPFDSEILANGVNENMKAYCSAKVDAVTVLQESDGGELRTEIVINISGYAVVSEEVNTVSDCYSKLKEIKASFDTLSWQNNICMANCTEKISGSVRLTEGTQRLRSVLAVCSPSLGSVTAIGKDNLTVEGKLTATVIYLDEEEKIKSLPISVPYSFILDREFVCKDSLCAYGSVLCVSARARHNDEIDITAEVSFEVNGTSENKVEYLKSVEVYGNKEVNNSAISLYYVGENETLWDVAKALSTDEETLIGLNPDINLPLKVGDKVLLFRND